MSFCATGRAPADSIGGSEKVGSSERFLLWLGKLGCYVCPSVSHWMGTVFSRCLYLLG